MRLLPASSMPRQYTTSSSGTAGSGTIDTAAINHKGCSIATDGDGNKHSFMVIIVWAPRSGKASAWIVVVWHMYLNVLENRLGRYRSRHSICIPRLQNHWQHSIGWAKLFNGRCRGWRWAYRLYTGAPLSSPALLILAPSMDMSKLLFGAIVITSLDLRGLDISQGNVMRRSIERASKEGAGCHLTSFYLYPITKHCWRRL